MLESDLLIQLLDLSNSYYTNWFKKYVSSTYYVALYKFDKNINIFKLNLQKTCWVQVDKSYQILLSLQCVAKNNMKILIYIKILMLIFKSVTNKNIFIFIKYTIMHK